MKLFILIPLLFLFLNSFSVDSDSLQAWKHQAESAQIDSVKIFWYSKIVVHYYQAGKFILAYQILLDAQCSIQSVSTVYFNSELSNIEFLLRANYPEVCESILRNRIKNFKKDEPKKNLAFYYTHLGRNLMLRGRLDVAYDYIIKSKIIFEELNNKDALLITDFNLASFYLRSGKIPESKSILDHIYPESYQNNIREINYLKLMHLAWCLQTEQPDSALLLFYKASTFASNQSQKMIVLSQIGEMYNEKKEFDSAIVFLKKAKNIAIDMGDKRDAAIWLTSIGSALINKGQNRTAVDAMLSALKIQETINNPWDVSRTCGLLSDAYVMLGDYKNAYHYRNEFDSINNVLDSKAAQRNLADLQTKYETEKRDKEISLLNKDKKIQQEEISKQKIMRNTFIIGFAIVLLFAGIFLKQRNKIKIGKQRSDELLLNILPSEVAEELKAKGSAEAKHFDDVTVMFTDFKNFTQISEKLSPAELVAEIHTCFKAFDNIIGNHNIEKIKTIGDAYMCAGGLPVANSSHAEDVVKAALEIVQFMNGRMGEPESVSNPPFTDSPRLRFELRVGIHTGPVVAGIVGVKKFAYDIWGDTVNIASRMESSSEAGKINISGSTYELVKDKFTCTHRGKIQAKNKGEIDMYFVELPI